MKQMLTAILFLYSSYVYSVDGDESTVVDQNIEAVKAVFEALETGDLQTLNRIFHPRGKSIIGSETRERGGPHQSFAEAAPFPAALDKRKVEIETLFGVGDMVAIQSKICGIHSRQLVGFKPTKERLCARYTNLYRFESGRIVSNTVGFDPQLRKTLEKYAKK